MRVIVRQILPNVIARKALSNFRLGLARKHQKSSNPDKNIENSHA